MRGVRRQTYFLRRVREDMAYTLERFTRWSDYQSRLRVAWTADGHFVNVRHIAERLEFVKEGGAL